MRNTIIYQHTLESQCTQIQMWVFLIICGVCGPEKLTSLFLHFRISRAFLSHTLVVSAIRKKYVSVRRNWLETSRYITMVSTASLSVQPVQDIKWSYWLDSKSLIQLKRQINQRQWQLSLFSWLPSPTLIVSSKIEFSTRSYAFESSSMRFPGSKLRMGYSELLFLIVTEKANSLVDIGWKMKPNLSILPYKKRPWRTFGEFFCSVNLDKSITNSVYTTSRLSRVSFSCSQVLDIQEWYTRIHWCHCLLHQQVMGVCWAPSRAQTCSMAPSRSKIGGSNGQLLK